MIGPLAGVGREGNGREREREAWLMKRGEKKLLFNFKSKLLRPKSLFLREISTNATISWFKLAFFWTKECKKSLVRPFLSLANVFIDGIANKSLHGSTCSDEGKLSAREALGQINWSRDLELIYTWPSACSSDFLRGFFARLRWLETSFTKLPFRVPLSHDEGECEPIWAADISILLSWMTSGHD